MGTCYSKNIIQIKINETSVYITKEDMKTVKTMDHILNKIGIYRNSWRRLELEDGSPLFEYSTLRYQTILITLNSGQQKRIEIIPLYRKKAKSHR